jgi:hypothetical protein
MLGWFREIDRILRGDVTRPTELAAGTIHVPLRPVSAAAVLLGLIYGFFMGWFALVNRRPWVTDQNLQQVLAATLKVPLLFLLTLGVTFPSLYVFNALVGSRLTLGSVFRLLMAALGVTLAVLASFGPIVAFFSLSTENYSFMVLLNVVLFAVAGVLGLAFLLQTLRRLSAALSAEFGWGAGAASTGETASPVPPGQAWPVPPGQGPPVSPAQMHPGQGAPAAPWATPLGTSLGALDQVAGVRRQPAVAWVFRCWVLIFALVGAQMSWVLRPFIGNPKLPFEWFRPRSSNFFEAVFHTIESLFR